MTHSAIEKLVSFIQEHYGIDVIDVKSLEGYANLNFRVKDKNGNLYVYKSNQHTDDLLFFESETAVLDQLNKRLPNNFPKPIQAKNGFL